MAELEKILRLDVVKRVPFPGECIEGVFTVGENTVYVELAPKVGSEDAAQDAQQIRRLALVDARAGAELADKSALGYPCDAVFAGDATHLYAALGEQGLAVVHDGAQVQRLDLGGKVDLVACGADGLVAAVVDKSAVVLLRDLKEEARIDLRSHHWFMDLESVEDATACAVCDDGVYAAIGGWLLFAERATQSVRQVKLPDSLGSSMTAYGAYAFVDIGSVGDVATLSGGEVVRVNSFRDCINSLFADHQGLLYVVQGCDELVVVKDGKRLGTTCFSDPHATRPTAQIDCIEVSREQDPTVYLGSCRFGDALENELLLLKKRWYHVVPDDILRE